MGFSPFYSSRHAFYDRYWGRNLHFGVFEQSDEDLLSATDRTIRLVAGLLNLSAANNILDLASGYCGLAAYVQAQIGCAATSLDRDLVPLAVDRRDRPSLHHVAAATQCLPFQNSSFDRLCCLDAGYLFREPNRCFAEMARVLPRGSILVVTDLLGTGDLPNRVQRYYSEFHGAPVLQTEQEVLARLQANSLRDIEVIDQTSNLSRSYEAALRGIATGKPPASISDQVRTLVPNFENCRDAASDGTLRWVWFRAVKGG